VNADENDCGDSYKATHSLKNCFVRIIIAFLQFLLELSDVFEITSENDIKIILQLLLGRMLLLYPMGFGCTHAEIP